MSISIICACKNRYDALRVSLNSWLTIKDIHEIIIVDWSSDEPLNHLTKLDSRIKIVRVEDKKYFNQPQPLNLAASLATGDYILKMDTDYVINPYYNFVEKYFPDHNSFTSGNPNIKSSEFLNPETGLYMINKYEMNDQQLQEYYNSYSPYFLYLTGLLFISKENYDKIGGYNENLGKCYAYEDDEIFQRLRYMGLNENKLDYDNSLIHLPHPDSKRTENFEGFGWDENYKNMIRENLSPHYSGQELEWQVEYALSQKHIEENKNMIGEISDYYVKPNTNWNIIKINNQNYLAEEINMKNKLDGLTSVYYVSLEECVDRQKSIQNQFEKYNISPKSIISKRFSESNDIVTGKYLDTLNAGTKGCCVSHLKAIKDWYENTQEDYGFFCEDDLSLETVDYWDFTWDEFIDSLPEDADCVQLLTIRSNFDTFEIRERYWDDWGATAYILTRDYAKKIIDNYIKGDTYHLEVVNYEVMPLIENIIFTSLGKTYTIPLFVENTEFVSTFENNDDDVNGGQKTNHKVARDLVLEWWKNKNKNKKEVNLNSITKSEIEELITTYSLDTENAENNFALGVWYENQGHTAPALTYFLRCAERAEDEDLAYEALIRGSYCYEKQGTRDGSARSLLWQAQAFLPHRPEAYFLLSRFAEKREWWQDCYMNADLALRYCNFDCLPLKTNIEYPGKYGLLFEKSIAAWMWGKDRECRMLLQEIKNNYVVSKEYYDIIENKLLTYATGHVPETEIKYNQDRHEQLRFKFDGSDKIQKNYSQSFQDMFILALLQGKRNGLYLEVGAQEPFYQNNTALLETEYDWKGISIEIRQDLCNMFSEQRKNQIVCQDATKIDYIHLLDQFNQGTNFDYLQLDCEPSKTTFEILLSIPFEKYKFAIITYEHDHYVDMTNSYRDKSRKYLKLMGYEMVVSNVSPTEWSPFEDWWYHPDLVDPQMVELMKDADDTITDIRKYMFN